jgi:hypothetical protein
MDFALLRGAAGMIVVGAALIGCNRAPPEDAASASLTPPQVIAGTEAERGAKPIAAPTPHEAAPASHQEEVACLDLAWITGDYVAAVLIHPRQILQKQKISGESRAWLDAAAEELGVNLAELEQVSFLLGPPEANHASAEPAPLTTAWIFRFATADGRERMMQRFLGEASHREVAHEGGFYYKAQDAPLAVCAPDERTVLLANERHVKRAFGGPSRSLLLTRLGAIEGRPDAAGAVDAAPLRGLLRRVKDGERNALNEDALSASPWLKQLSATLSKLKEATFTADFAEAPLARLTLEAEDSQGAVQLEELVLGYRATASLLLLGAEAQWVRGEEGRGFAPLFALGRNALAGVAAKRDLRRVTVEMAPPPELTALPSILESSFVALARGNARQERVRRLQLIGLAMHNHHVARGAFPAACSRDMAGRPLLSWRVHLLPWLGQEDLYHQFRLDQPWDSPHNAALLARIPAVYQTGGAATGQTRIVALIGPGTPFASSRGPALRDFTGGPDHTILMVECGPDRAVPWTQPDDRPFDSDNPISALGTIDAAGFLALFGDGRVEIIRPEISPAELRDLLTHAGGELPEPAK